MKTLQWWQRALNHVLAILLPPLQCKSGLYFQQTAIFYSYT